MPEKIGEVILVDEVHRMKVDETTARFLFVTDSLSRYSKLYPIGKKEFSSEGFLQLLLQVKKDFTHKGTHQIPSAYAKIGVSVFHLLFS